MSLFGCDATKDKNSGSFNGNIFSSEIIGWEFKIPSGWEIVDLYNQDNPEKNEQQPEGVRRAFAFHSEGRRNQCVVRIYDYNESAQTWKSFITDENNKFLETLLRQNYAASAATTTYPVKNVPFTMFEIYPSTFGQERGQPGFLTLNAYIQDYRLEIALKLIDPTAKNLVLDQLDRSIFSFPGKE